MFDEPKTTWKSSLIGVPDSVFVTEDFQDATTKFAEKLAIVPDAAADKGLQRAHRAAVHGLCDILGIATFTAMNESFDNRRACPWLPSPPNSGAKRSRKRSSSGFSAKSCCSSMSGLSQTGDEEND